MVGPEQMRRERAVVVRSFQNGFGLVGALVLLGFAGFAAWAVVTLGATFLRTIGTLAVAALSVYLAWSVIPPKMSVTLAGIHERKLGSSRWYSWKDIRRIEVAPGIHSRIPGLGYIFAVEPIEWSGQRRNRNIAIAAMFYANGHRLTRAILEAAELVNPEIAIDPILADSYGPPPYGIFVDDLAWNGRRS